MPETQKEPSRFPRFPEDIQTSPAPGTLKLLDNLGLAVHTHNKCDQVDGDGPRIINLHVLNDGRVWLHSADASEVFSIEGLQLRGRGGTFNLNRISECDQALTTVLRGRPVDAALDVLNLREPLAALGFELRCHSAIYMNDDWRAPELYDFAVWPLSAAHPDGRVLWLGIEGPQAESPARGGLHQGLAYTLRCGGYALATAADLPGTRAEWPVRQETLQALIDALSAPADLPADLPGGVPADFFEAGLAFAPDSISGRVTAAAMQLQDLYMHDCVQAHERRRAQQPTLDRAAVPEEVCDF